MNSEKMIRVKFLKTQDSFNLRDVTGRIAGTEKFNKMIFVAPFALDIISFKSPLPLPPVFQLAQWKVKRLLMKI